MDNQESYIARTSGLKAKDYIGYAMGDAAGCLVFSLVTNLLQKFYTDVLYLSPLFIMFMFIAARVWDAVNDPIMGRICDTVKPAASGRYRRWFRIIAVPLALSSILMFIKWPCLDGEVNTVGTCIYATVTYLLFGMCYTVLQIPYGSLASVVTTDAGERNRLSVFRSIGATVGSIPVLLIASFAYAKRVDEAGNYVIGENGRIITDMQAAPVLTGVIIMSVCSMIMLFLTYRLNKERVVAKPAPREKGAAMKAVKRLVSNRAFMAVSLAAMLLLAGQMFTQSFYLYLFNDYFNANWMNMASQACTYAPMLVLMFLMPKMARKIGKKEVCAVGTLLASLSNLVLFFLRGQDPSSLIYLFLIVCAVSGFGLTTLVMQLWAMIADAIDDIEVRTGSRDDGTAYSFFNFFRKLGQVIAAICVNGALLGMNYKYEKGAVQTLENLKVMYDMATIIPAVLFGLISLILFFLFPLSRKKVEELQVRKEEVLRESYENHTIEIG